MLADPGVVKATASSSVPMIPEAVISMQRWRGGAIHSVVFGGFAPPGGLRIDDHAQ
jgi:acyl-coenzyme A synthetase/AMP-(fatty) acid ligase